ncbi:hypothetical protein ATN83_0920 [Raoultella ornithinolytica]|nr:hypothetical protein ATN83_0920 [Raoultella ornithinolytica]
MPFHQSPFIHSFYPLANSGKSRRNDMDDLQIQRHINMDN